MTSVTCWSKCRRSQFEQDVIFNFMCWFAWLNFLQIFEEEVIYVLFCSKYSEKRILTHIGMKSLDVPSLEDDWHAQLAQVQEHNWQCFLVKEQRFIAQLLSNKRNWSPRKYLTSPRLDRIGGNQSTQKHKPDHNIPQKYTLVEHESTEFWKMFVVPGRHRSYSKISGFEVES